VICTSISVPYWNGYNSVAMHEAWNRLSQSRAGGYVLALVLTAIATGVIVAIDQAADVANISMLYLLAVMAGAIAFGSGPAIVASLAAFLAFNFFLINPRYRLAVSDPEEWVALGLLLVAGIITGQLAAALRNRARDAKRREREAVVLYDVVRLMAGSDVSEALTAVAERLRRELELAAVLIHLGEAAPVQAHAESGDSQALELARAAGHIPGLLRREGEAPTAARRGSPGRWIRIVPPALPGQRALSGGRLHVVPIAAQDRPIGSLVLVRPATSPPWSVADDRLLSAVTNQIHLTLERARLREEAMKAEVLRRADEVKSALLSAVSHDLRTPLSSIIASAGSLLQEDVAWTEEERRDFAAAIEEEARRLNRLVGNLLDLSRIEAGTLRPERRWYDLGTLVADVLGRLRPTTAQHAVVVDVADDLPPVPLDYVEIDEVLCNLIENATSYTPLGAEIRVSARRAGDQVEVEVADRGPGIPSEALPHLFEPFYRVRTAGAQSRGTGLGLAVAKGLVEAHGGRIWAENRPAGGARFVFTLPLSEAAPVPAEHSERVG
jgi:two-component system sensor histidine kinase KdpD